MSSKKKSSKSKAKKKFNAEGLGALQKTRFFTYLIFVFALVAMFHTAISNLIGVSDTKILYGFILMIGAQALVGSMHIVKYASTISDYVEKDRQKNATMYSARVRFFILFQYIVLILMMINHHQHGGMFFDVVLAIASVLLVIATLQNVTVLQRYYL